MAQMLRIIPAVARQSLASQPTPEPTDIGLFSGVITVDL